MKRISATFVVIAMACLGVGSAMAATQIMVPANFTVPAVSSTGASFTHNGVVVPGDTLSMTVAGPVYLQTGPAYGTNAAGVVLLAGLFSGETVGSASEFGTIDNIEFDFGSLAVSVTSGGTTYYGRLFLATKRAGLGGKHPPASLTYKATLKKLFGADAHYKPFKFIDPTFTFTLVDTSYTDNTGAFTVNNNSPA